MKQIRRLTRTESREITRDKLIRAAEKIFIRDGFGASAVEQIAEAAGFSRGAFYSNFADKDALFLAVLHKRRVDTLHALDEIFHQKRDTAERLCAVRDWYVNQSQQREWAILKTEFQLRAFRDRTVRERLSALRQQELARYTALVAQFFTEAGIKIVERPETIALLLLSTAEGLGSTSLIDTGPEPARSFAEARNLLFNRLVSIPNEQVLTSPKQRASQHV